MISLIVVAVLIVFVVYIATKLLARRKVYNYLLNNFKCPPRHPFLGNLHLIPRNLPGIFKTIQDLNRTYGKNFLFTRPFYDALIVIADPKDIESILSNPNTKKAKKATFYETLEPWLGTGLLTGWGDKWFTRRKIITPSFHFSILEGFVEVMTKQADLLVKNLQQHIGKEVDIYPLINAFALDVICDTSMGVTVNAQSNPNSEYVLSVKKMTGGIQSKINHPLGKFPYIYNYLTAKGRDLKKLTNTLHQFTNKVITDRRNQLLRNDVPEKGGRMNFLDILLYATADGKPLTNSDIREEVDTFMFEGHDTTASGIAFTLYLLSRHSDVQEKVYQELMDVFGNEIRMSSKNLNDLTYLEMVVKESLRLFPPVPGIGRQLTEDTTIGGVVVPAGCNISLQIYAMHHNPDNFTDPEKFDPERFSPYNSKDIRNFAYIPFSAGGRNCIGQKFAMLDLKASVAKVIMNYKLLAGPEIILQGDLILKASNGVNIRVENRT